MFEEKKNKAIVCLLDKLSIEPPHYEQNVLLYEVYWMNKITWSWNKSLKTQFFFFLLTET